LGDVILPVVVRLRPLFMAVLDRRRIDQADLAGHDACRGGPLTNATSPA